MDAPLPHAKKDSSSDILNDEGLSYLREDFSSQTEWHSVEFFSYADTEVHQMANYRL